LSETVRFVGERQIGDTVLASYQMTQARIADMATGVDAAALLVYRAAWTKDSGASRISREASMAKLYATEEAQRIIDSAVQLHGGQGVRTGRKVEELYRDIRAMRVYEGASEIQKLIIARQTLGAP
jgi:acyl-CoA dehydrogenase